jgi:hypothetical protein
MNSDPKIIYAQSSDIKSRTYLEYRKDMKKKAIAELESIEWLSKKLTDLHKQKTIVKKNGSDENIWFLRKGGISSDSDYVAMYGNNKEYFEFQYSNIDTLDFFDFKVSKVGKKIKGKRIPFTDKKFIYIVKSSLQYAFIDAEWIMHNGIEATVPAWGNRTAYRVPNETFKSKLVNDDELKSLVEIIKIKTDLLEFQHEFIKIEEHKLSLLFQSVIDKNNILNIIPNNLESFYRSCFIIDRLNDIPKNANLWLIYLFSYFRDDLTSYQLAQLIYSMDFLYSKIELNLNEINCFIDILNKILKYCNKMQQKDGRVSTSIDISPIEEIRHFLFIQNLLEDLIQDCKYYYNAEINGINKIFENIKYIKHIHNIIINKK